MHRFMVALLTLLLAGTAMASITGTSPDTVKDPGTPYVNPPMSRTVGDNIATPFILAGLGTVTGSTAGFTNDYDEVCSYSGSTAPDVVYAYTPAANMAVTIDLCYSSYDTKLYVYDNAWTPGVPLACNDDFHTASPCGMYTSKLASVTLVSGHIYYIVIDGYGGESGAYQMDVTDAGVPPVIGACCQLSSACTITTQVACVSPNIWHPEFTNCTPNPCPPPASLECPAGALVEGEPPCVAPVGDHYNGGCNFTPYIYQPLDAQADGCAVMCGKSCVADGYRDTDWFVSSGTGGLVTATCTAEFPLQFILLYNTDCDNPQIIIAHGAIGEPVTLTYTVADGAQVGFWVGCDGFFPDWPESDYVLSVCGIQGTGACCAPAGTCTISSQASCIGTWTMGSVCEPNPCPQPPGACCHDGACIMVDSEALCQFMSGVWQGPGTQCTPTLCIPSGVDDGPLATVLGFRVVPTLFAAKTTLVFAGPKATEASLLIFDVSGRRVRSAWQGILTGRTITLEWDGRDDSGRETPAGVYLARLRSGTGVVDARLVKVR